MVALCVLFSITSSHSANLKPTKKITFRETIILTNKKIEMNRGIIK